MKQTVTTLSLADTGAFPKLITDYINEDKSLTAFYNRKPTIEACAQTMDEYNANPVNRVVLVDALKRQYEEVPSKNKGLINSTVEALLKPDTYTVCTGHQLCLFTGPLYFIYKIVTTLNLAQELKKKYPARNFVPLYWMASEDHDFEEINNVTVFEKKLTWNYPDPAGPVGKFTTATLAPLLTELRNLLGVTQEAQTLNSLFEEAYLKHNTLAAATRYLVDALFADYGLLILDADDKQLKQLFIPVIKDDILNASNYNLVNNTVAELNELGFKQQVNPRAINIFYMKAGLRERIEKVGSNYNVLNTDIVFTEKELFQAIDNNPEQFSPNVVLRPVYQQLLLPNLAYIGGPGELAYWLQLKAVFDNYKVVFPALWLRNTVLVADAKSLKVMDKFNLSAKDLFADGDLLVNNYMKQLSAAGISLQEEEQQLKQLFTAIAGKVQKIDVTLKASVDAESQKAANAIKTLEAKLLKAEKQKHETTVSQIKKLKARLFPDGHLQERSDNIVPYYLQYGKDFIPLLIKHLNPLAFQFTVISIADD